MNPRRNRIRMKSSLAAFTEDDPKENVEKWDVKRYQKQHSFVYEYGASLVDLVKPQPGERILDVGCGSGELTHQLHNNNKGDLTVLGMDADPNMVAQAQKQYPNLTFLLADVQNFSLDDPVDCIFSNAALHWALDADRAVKCMAQALKPGGRFIVEFGGRGNIEQIVEVCQRVLLQQTGKTVSSPWYFPSIAEYASLLSKHGIEATRVDLYDRPTVLEDGEHGLSNWIRMFGSFFLNKAVDEEAFLKAVNDDLRQSKLWDGQTWTADYRRLRVIGKKLAE